MNSKSRSTVSRSVLKGSVIAATGALLLAGCAASGNEDAAASFEGEQITFIVPTSAGGGIDTAARQLQPYLEEALGATIVVKNVPGGATTLGSNDLLQVEDCSAMLITGIPHITLSYMTNDVDFDLSSFSAIGGVSVEPGVIRVARDSEWDSFDDLIDDAKANPGEIRFSISEVVSSNFIGLKQIEEAADVDFNIVAFDGGGPSRIAVVSGEVEATHAGVFNSLSVAEDTKVLAVQADENLWGDVTDDAETVAEALGFDVPDNEATYNLWTSAPCEKEHADRYQLLVDAIEPILENEAYIAELEALGEQDKVDYRDPARVMDDAVKAEEDIQALIDEDPDVFVQ